MTDPTVDVVVVTWRARELTLTCLDALRAQDTTGLAVRLVVVDNASDDGTVEALAAAGDVRVLALPTNTGFAGGAQAALAASDADVVVLVNNDAVAEPGFLRALVAPLTGPGRVGATTGRVVLAGRFAPAGPGAADALVGHDGRRWARVPDGDPDGVRLLNSTGNEVTRSGNGRDRDWLRPADAAPAPARVFGLNGGCAALRRDAATAVGGFDPDLFLYYEDTDLSWRLRRAGWEVVHVPDAVTVHRHAASSGTGSALFQHHNVRNRLLVALANAPWPVVGRALLRTLARTVLGPHRRRWAGALLDAARRAPRALARRRRTDATAVVPRAGVAAFLVPDGAP